MDGSQDRNYRKLLLHKTDEECTVVWRYLYTMREYTSERCRSAWTFGILNLNDSLSFRHSVSGYINKTDNKI